MNSTPRLPTVTNTREHPPELASDRRKENTAKPRIPAPKKFYTERNRKMRSTTHR